MFKFQAKFLRKPTAAPTIMPNVPTSDAAKTTTTTNHLHSRLMLERQRREICSTSDPAALQQETAPERFPPCVMYGYCKQSTHTSRFE